MTGSAADDAALRRVATLAARQAPQGEVMAAVVEELAGLCGTGVRSTIYRYDVDASPTVVAVHEGRPRSRAPSAAPSADRDRDLVTRVLGERRPLRIDTRSPAPGTASEQAGAVDAGPTVGCPVVVENRLWGVLLVARRAPEPFPPEAEHRISEFAELLAIAIANTEARAEAQRLVDQQAALRRVATLVARGAAPEEVFDAVVGEVGQLLGAAQVGLARYEGGVEISVVAIRGQDPSTLRPGMRLPIRGDNLSIRIQRTGRSGRFDHRHEGQGVVSDVVRDNDISVTVGAPVFVDGALWGMIGASWKGADLPPSDAEERLGHFAELVDTAIANADTRAKLVASRARVLAAGDEARRRVVRDLHDGAQQRLVHTIIALKLAQRAVDEDHGRLEELLAEALSHAEQGNTDLRELAHGMLPSVLTRGGLRAAVDSIVSRIDLPVDVSVPSTRLPPEIESSAYFVLAEALTNVVKHSQATKAEVVVAICDNTLRLEVQDDGVGAADPGGQGLTGISDRVASLDGTLRIESGPSGGTLLVAELPLPPSFPVDAAP